MNSMLKSNLAMISLINLFSFIPSLKDQVQKARQRKIVVTLATVTGAFAFCWAPFVLYYLVYGFECICYFTDWRLDLYIISSWLGFVNSGVNPIIYTMF